MREPQVLLRSHACYCWLISCHGQPVVFLKPSHNRGFQFVKRLVLLLTDHLELNHAQTMCQDLILAHDSNFLMNLAGA